MLKEMSIEIIRKCPNYCVHCSSSSSVDCREIITFDSFKKVVDSALKLQLETLCFSGGEPFLHPDFIEMVQYAAAMGIQINIYTSGIYMDDNSVKSSIPMEMLFQLKDTVTKLIFNIESVHEPTYNKIMGTKDCFKYLKQTIQTAIEIGLVCEAHFVPMKYNIEQIEETVVWCEKMGISKVSFLRLVPHGRALVNKEQILLKDTELDILKAELLKMQIGGRHSIRIGVPLSESGSETYCEAGTRKLNIKYDGLVYPCEAFKNAPIVSQNGGYPDSIYEKSIDEIFYNSIFLKNIRNFIKKFSQLEKCENCAGQFYIQSLYEEDGD